MVVDYQTHWHPPAYLASIAGRTSYPWTERIRDGYLYHGPRDNRLMLGSRFINLEEQIADMDRNGIDVMVCSPNLLGEVAPLDLSEALETTQLLNQELADAQRGYPDRFVGLAMLPMQDTSAALEALNVAIQELGLRGVCMISHIDGEPMASEKTLPVYRRIEELRVPLFIHPGQRSSVYQAGEARALEAGLSWVHDTSKAALSLILSGTLDACPDLTVVHPHLGGTLPYVIGRVAFTMRRTTQSVERPPSIAMPVGDYLTRRFYTDTASHTPGSLQLAINTYGIDRVLFGSDYPFVPREEGLAYVRDNASGPDVDAILNRTALPGLTLPNPAAK